jgi:DnaJ family protein C protein 19
MASVLAVGIGVAAAAFFVCASTTDPLIQPLTRHSQGRAGLVALRRARGGGTALGKSYYKGGFEKTMNRKEAALILETSYVDIRPCCWMRGNMG